MHYHKFALVKQSSAVLCHYTADDPNASLAARNGKVTLCNVTDWFHEQNYEVLSNPQG